MRGHLTRVIFEQHYKSMSNSTKVRSGEVQWLLVLKLYKMVVSDRWRRFRDPRIYREGRVTWSISTYALAICQQIAANCLRIRRKSCVVVFSQIMNELLSGNHNSIWLQNLPVLSSIKSHYDAHALELHKHIFMKQYFSKLCCQAFLFFLLNNFVSKETR